MSTKIAVQILLRDSNIVLPLTLRSINEVDNAGKLFFGGGLHRIDTFDYHPDCPDPESLVWREVEGRPYRVVSTESYQGVLVPYLRRIIEQVLEKVRTEASALSGQSVYYATAEIRSMGYPSGCGAKLSIGELGTI